MMTIICVSHHTKEGQYYLPYLLEIAKAKINRRTSQNVIILFDFNKKRRMNAQSNQESTRGLVVVHYRHTFDISEEDSSSDSSESASSVAKILECDLGLMANNNKEINQ